MTTNIITESTSSADEARAARGGSAEQQYREHRVPSVSDDPRIVQANERRAELTARLKDLQIERSDLLGQQQQRQRERIAAAIDHAPGEDRESARLAEQVTALNDAVTITSGAVDAHVAAMSALVLQARTELRERAAMEVQAILEEMSALGATFERLATALDHLRRTHGVATPKTPFLIAPLIGQLRIESAGFRR